jgi:hypothetical protein
MIQKFEQFINESHAGGVFDSLREPIDRFIERVKERTKIFTERIQEISDDMNNVVNVVMEEFGDIIDGEPIVNIDRDLMEIEVLFNTNIADTDEAWETDESPAMNLEYRLDEVLGRYNKIEIHFGVTSPSGRTTDAENGNCVIYLRTYVVDKNNFGDFTESLSTFGQEY